MQGLLILDPSITLDLPRLNVRKLNTACVTPLEASEDPTLCCEAVNRQCKLKRDHAYFVQVQGQMGVTGASWCDFIIYTKKGISVERIAFDPAYWAELRQKLALLL